MPCRHGHSVDNRQQLQQIRDTVIGIRNNVASLKRQGRSLQSLQEIVAAEPIVAYDECAGFVIDAPLFTKLVYQGI